MMDKIRLLAALAVSAGVVGFALGSDPKAQEPSRPRPGLTVYNASKGAVHLMTKSMAVEFAPDNIRVCALAPVAGETPLLATFLGADTPERRAAFKATVPLGRFSKPEDIGLAALYLASDEANFLTGVVLEVDGGRCI